MKSIIGIPWIIILIDANLLSVQRIPGGAETRTSLKKYLIFRFFYIVIRIEEVDTPAFLTPGDLNGFIPNNNFNRWGDGGDR